MDLLNMDMMVYFVIKRILIKKKIFCITLFKKKYMKNKRFCLNLVKLCFYFKFNIMEDLFSKDLIYIKK